MTDAGPGDTHTDAEGVAALEHIEQELAKVEAALARLDDGTYGTCIVCGEPIPDSDLADDPLTAACLMHQG